MNQSPLTLIDAKTMGAELGLSGQTVINMTKAGKIPVEVQEGKIYRFDPEKVRAALAARAQKGSAR